MSLLRKGFLSIVLLSSSWVVCQYELTKQTFHAPESLGEVKLFYSDTDNHFLVLQNNTMHVVQKAFMDPQLRSMDTRTLHAFLGKGYLDLKQMSTGEYSLKAKVRGLGGGAIGATIGTVAGAALVQGTYHTALGGLQLGLSMVVTPVIATGIVGTVRYFTLPFATAATKIVAVSGGIFVGTITGPI